MRPLPQVPCRCSLACRAWNQALSLQIRSYLKCRWFDTIVWSIACLGLAFSPPMAPLKVALTRRGCSSISNYCTSLKFTALSHTLPSTLYHWCVGFLFAVPYLFNSVQICYVPRHALTINHYLLHLQLRLLYAQGFARSAADESHSWLGNKGSTCPTRPHRSTAGWPGGGC
jgi:hypothetical protein